MLRGLVLDWRLIATSESRLTGIRPCATDRTCSCGGNLVLEEEYAASYQGNGPHVSLDKSENAIQRLQYGIDGLHCHGSYDR